MSGAASARTAATAVLATIPAQVYLHIGSESARPKSNALSKELSAAGFQAMGTENIAGKAGTPDRTQVRFFNEADKPAADTVVALLRERGVNDAVSVSQKNLKARPGTIEIWFSKDTE